MAYVLQLTICNTNGKWWFILISFIIYIRVPLQCNSFALHKLIISCLPFSTALIAQIWWHGTAYWLLQIFQWVVLCVVINAVVHTSPPMGELWGVLQVFERTKQCFNRTLQGWWKVINLLIFQLATRRVEVIGLNVFEIYCLCCKCCANGVLKPYSVTYSDQTMNMWTNALFAVQSQVC